MGMRALETLGSADAHSDEEVLALARAEGRIVISEDKDFGALVFRRKLPHAGVLLLRLPHSLPADIMDAVDRAVVAAGERLGTCFVVMR